MIKQGETPGNRDKLLRGALACLRDKGYARTTARDLAAASGANLASIGYHYGSKEALLNEAIAVGFQEWVAEIERTAFAAESATPLERLERSLAASIDRFRELQPFLHAFVEAFPQAVRAPELRERMARAYADARAAGAEMIVRAVRADGGEIAPEHARTLSSVLTAVTDGLILQWLLEHDAVPSSGQLMDALAAAAAVLSRSGASPAATPPGATSPARTRSARLRARGRRGAAPR